MPQEDQSYLLLTPGPLTTSMSVKATMLKDWCTWDNDYNVNVVEDIRARLTALATTHNNYSTVLMQGSGTASVESVIGSALSTSDTLLVIDNGAYGARIKEIANILKVPFIGLDYPETTQASAVDVDKVLNQHPQITHVAMVHCETTTGMLNPVAEIVKTVKKYQKCFILDAMSSFGGIEMDIGELDIDFMISSANKCIQGVPGFGFVIAKRDQLLSCKGQARSLSLDLFDQWHTMESCQGKWRFTSPTHVVRAFQQALNELEDEGGIKARAARYRKNQQALIAGMEQLDFVPLLPAQLHSPIISSFHSPAHSTYQFSAFYKLLKTRGFVIYPGKVSQADCFRIGNIGEVGLSDIQQLLNVIKEVKHHWS
jgi:2-aminoethylphosphonate-pyruvate transaminase